MNCFIIAAITADGFIARDASQVSTSWTSQADKKWFSQRTKEAGVVVMGGATYRTINRPLPERLTIVYSRTGGESTENLRFTQASPHELLQQLEKENYSEVAICGGSSIYTMFMKAGLVTKLYFTVEPVIFGTGVPLFSEALTNSLQLVQTRQLSDQTTLLEFDVVS